VTELLGPCQTPVGGCPAPGTIKLTYQTAPLMGRFPGPGLTIRMGICPGHRNAQVGRILAEGGQIVEEQVIPLPEPIQPTPVGLDAVAPAPTPEPIRQRKRRTPRRKGAS
jgi:hypothetical protein